MRYALLRFLFWLLRVSGFKIVGLTVYGRLPYDVLRKRLSGKLEGATDGLSFKWGDCRVGYEMTPEDIRPPVEDTDLCSWCGEEWVHSLPNRLPRDRCESCARHVAQVRGVPWESVR